MIRTMKIRIKSVPDEFPNADGEWVTVELDETEYVRYHEQGRTWELLSDLLPEGYHAVAVGMGEAVEW